MMNILKSLGLAAALMMAPLAASAAGCAPGECDVDGADGQSLASGFVRFEIDNIRNGAGGSFTFTGLFDTGGLPGTKVTTTVLQFQQTTGAFIRDLVLTISDGVTDFVTQVTDANGFGLNMIGNDSVVVVDLGQFASNTLSLSFTGTAVKAPSGNDPDINVELSAVPLPAGGLLLISAFGVAAVARRRKAA